MKNTKQVLMIGSNIAFGLIVIFLCTKVLSGCAFVRRATVRERVVEVLKTAYENGGRAAVSNRIERLVADGTLSTKQGAKLHEIMQKAYDGLVRDLAKRIEDVAVEDTDNGGEGEDAFCGKCEDCKARDR